MRMPIERFTGPAPLMIGPICAWAADAPIARMTMARVKHLGNAGSLVNMDFLH
jgi:hypothetical protein